MRLSTQDLTHGRRGPPHDIDGDKLQRALSKGDASDDDDDKYYGSCPRK